MNGSRTHQHRRASQFDDAMLARKREYWRIKKREQRAKLSALKKEKLGVAHDGTCESVFAASAEPPRAFMAVAPSISSVCSLGEGHAFTPEIAGLEVPTLLNNDGSYVMVTSSIAPSLVQNCPLSTKCEDDNRTFPSPIDGVKNWDNTGLTADVSAGRLDSYHSCHLEKKQTTMSNQMEGCFEKTKIFPQFSKAYSGPDCNPNIADVSKDAVKCLPAGLGKGTFATAKPNGALLTGCSQVPAIQMDLPLNSSLYSQRHSDTIHVNGSSYSGLSQHHTEFQMELGQSNNGNMQAGVQSRDTSLSLTAGKGTEVKEIRHPSKLITGQTLAIKSTKVTSAAGEKATNVRELSTGLGLSQTWEKKVETEEERAARRREYWRIKKREQRAKLTARLAKAREKTSSLITPGQKTEQSSCLLLERASSGWFKDSRKQPANRVRTPLVPASLQRAGRLLRNAKAVAASCSALKCSSLMVKKEPSHSDPVVDSPALTDCVYLAVPTKTEKTHGTVALKRAATTAPPETALSPEKVEGGEKRWAFTRSRTQRQRFLEAQRMVSQQSMRKPFSPAAALMPVHVQGKNKEETAEEKLARKREYWRVKKREQRAKRSAEVKARMKERDTLLQRVRRYQSILEEMRKARAVVGHRALQPPENSLTDDTEAIGGFIKEDGTVTTEIPHASAHLRLSAPETTPEPPSFQNAALTVPRCDVSANTGKEGSVGCMQVDMSSFGCSQAKESCQRPVTRNVFRSAAKDVKNLHAAAPQILAPQRRSQNVPTTYPRITLIKHRPNVWQITRAVDNISHTHAKEAKDKRTLTAGYQDSKLAAAVPPQSSPLTEEEKMAKKREYWRIKKREQRAKRSSSGRVVFKHGTKENVKQEREDALTDGKCSVSDVHLCEDIKPPPLSPPERQAEADLTLTTDSQDATLLAVASMKKLLEESLSTVTDCNGISSCKSETLPCKSEEEAADQEVKANLPCAPDGGKDAIIPEQRQHEVKTSPQDSPLTHWQVQADRAVSPASCHTTVETTSTSQSVCAVPPSVSSSALPTLSTAPSSPSPSGRPPPLRRALRLPTKRTGHCYTPEHKKQPRGRSQSEEDVIQKKREYWRVMKREQRARKAARDKEKKGQMAIAIQLQDEVKWRNQEHMARKPAQNDQEVCRPVLPASMQQGPNICVVKVKEAEVQSAPPLQCLHPSGGASVASHKPASTLPTLLVVSPTPCSKDLSVDAVTSKPSESGVCLESAKHSAAVGTAGAPSEQRTASLGKTRGNEGKILLLDEGANSSSESPRVRRWRLQVPESSDLLPCQLSSPCTGTVPQVFGRSPNKHVKSSTKIPSCVMGEGMTSDSTELPKLTLSPAELDEDLRRKKREYWRGRKREQRARKAARDRELKQKTAAELTMRVGGTSDSLGQQEQNSGQWFNCTEETELLHGSSSQSDLALLPQLCHVAGMNGEVEIGLLEAEGDEDEAVVGTPSTAAAWRSRFLMDYDPLNQLLVCMVCGELQHSHTLGGVRAHIEEAHPDTMSLGLRERAHIQDAWDEQVSLRERFFSSQLQQQGPNTSGADPPAEVEVLVDHEDFTTVKNGKSSKSKNLKKV